MKTDGPRDIRIDMQTIDYVFRVVVKSLVVTEEVELDATRSTRVTARWTHVDLRGPMVVLEWVITSINQVANELCKRYSRRVAVTR